MTPDDLAAETEAIRTDEGLRLRPYHDVVSVLSIGYGRNLMVGIRESEAELMLQNDVQAALDHLRASLPYFPRLPGLVQRILLNMAFNLGIRGLLQFRKMLTAVEVGDWDEAADQMLASKWAGQVGPRARRLARMMRTGTD